MEAKTSQPRPLIATTEASPIPLEEPVTSTDLLVCPEPASAVVGSLTASYLMPSRRRRPRSRTRPGAPGTAARSQINPTGGQINPIWGQIKPPWEK